MEYWLQHEGAAEGDLSFPTPSPRWRSWVFMIWLAALPFS